ncbi:MAG: damage-inducible protein CinA [Fuerstiella sp.]|jgi:nicotinamide-nucleotide amidase|nr:damage-inducible protein CinA [Fuerstiella sp.]MCP4511018.1 damage-inducible protein CinA [Fuerstiella sp.]MDG2129971.1 molybdopterin-binding protein [Fuerstiella sp.]
MKAEIIAIGSELTCGARLDTNSQWLSRELEARGWTVQRHTTVADDREAMVRIYQEAAQRSRVVLVTGGLGPTLDDITRDTLAEAFGQDLVEDEDSLRHIEALFSSRGRQMPERNRVQALRPEFASVLHNAHGTAPGILLQLSRPACTIGVMPGVPAEMRRMFHEQLVRELPVSDVFVRRSVIRTFGFGESDAERLLGDLTARGRNPEVGITASDAVISLSVTARAGSEAECELLAAAVRDQIREKLGDAVFGEGEVELHHAVADQLLHRDLKIALLEGPTTGGLIGQWLTETEEIARRLAYSRLFPTSSSMVQGRASSPDLNGAWEQALREHGEKLLTERTADFVLLSSPSTLAVDSSGVRKQHGSIVLLGTDIDQSQDVSMTGNLDVFRSRAARMALNQLRLHLLKAR